VLNEIGGRVLELADGKVELSDVIELLEREYEADRELIASEVERFARELEEAGLVERVPETHR